MTATLHVHRDDTVVVLAGEDRGKTGKVLRVYPSRGRVLVEGINLVKRAVRKTQDNPRGGIVEREAPIDASNVMRLERWQQRENRRRGRGSR
jgi:large subunit ribosomal protein L24